MRLPLILLLLLIAPWAAAQTPAAAPAAATARTAPAAPAANTASSAPAAPAALPADPYSAAVPVPDQSDAARTAALGPALLEVLARASGLPATAPQLQALVARAPRLLQRYSYQRDPEGQLQLLAGFDPKGVAAALRAQNLAVPGTAAGPVEPVDLTIEGLRGVGDYSRALQALRAIPGQRSLRVLAADGARLQAQAELEGGLKSPPPGLEAIPDHPLHFRLAPAP